VNFLYDDVVSRTTNINTLNRLVHKLYATDRRGYVLERHLRKFTKFQ